MTMIMGEHPALSDQEIEAIARQRWESGLKTSLFEFMPFVIGVSDEWVHYS